MTDDLLSRAAALGIPLRALPPVPTTCCGRGCAACVWEGYRAAVAYWCEDAELALAACHNDLIPAFSNAPLTGHPL